LLVQSVKIRINKKRLVNPSAVIVESDKCDECAVGGKAVEIERTTSRPRQRHPSPHHGKESDQVMGRWWTDQDSGHKRDSILEEVDLKLF
jgi:hypothetical protein